jgi:RNA polymerase II subunit A C-terminal domain phosphatase SSU72
MLERNVAIKPAPQRWQDSEVDVDVVVCFEERVFDNVVADLKSRSGGTGEPLLVINLDVVDSHDEALVAAPHALKLCEMIDASEDWECECDEIMDKFAEEAGRRPIYTVCFY